MNDKPARQPNTSLFDPQLIPAEVDALNHDIVERLSKAPDLWKYPVDQIRKSREKGKGAFPLFPPDENATLLEIKRPEGPVPVRVLRPVTVPERGTYLHYHGGGWIMGTPQENDERLRRLCEATGLATISVDYRLAPEHPFPAGPKDCYSAMGWLLGSEGDQFNKTFLAVGGESAGAHLAALSLIRLRDQTGNMPFSAAILTAGCYDVGGTPSVRNWGDERLILRTRDVMKFADMFVPNGEDRRRPDISPLYADLYGLPAALFSCGTKDLLIDDSMFMAGRWEQAGNYTETGIFPGGCHVFQWFDSKQAFESLDQIHGFLNRMMEDKSQQ